MSCKQCSDSERAEMLSGTSEQSNTSSSSISYSTNNKDSIKSPLTPLQHSVLLNMELQEALKAGEKYKNDFNTLCRKFDDLLKRNAQLKDDLVASNERVRSLLDRDSPICKGCCTNIRLELEFKTKIGLLESDIVHWKEEAATSEELAKTLKLELEELKADFRMRGNSVDGLKSKIVDLYVEIQNLRQENIKINNALAMLSSELQSVRKSEAQLKEQLHQSHTQKSSISEEALKLKLLLASKERDLELSILNYQRLKKTYEQLQLSELNKSKNYDLEQNILDSCESTLDSLSEKITLIKIAMDEQQAAYEALVEQNHAITAQNATLQKLSATKDTTINILEAEKKKLEANVDNFSETLRKNERLLIEAVGSKSEMESTLIFALNEKNQVEEAIKKIRQDFSQLASIHYKFKEELLEKNKQITDFGEQLQELNVTNQRLQNENIQLKEINDNHDHFIINILEWVLHSLQDMETCTKPKQNTDSLIGRTSSNQLSNIVENISKLFGSISEKLQRICLVNKQLRLKFVRLKELEDKCTSLSQSIKNDSQTLQALRSCQQLCKHDANNNREDYAKFAEELKQMRVVLKAKELEMAEMQIKYEMSNHTLLKKVKEHMQERHAAEARWAHLNKLYNNALNELGSHKVQNGEIQLLREACDSYGSANGEMKERLLQMEEELMTTKTCTNCEKLQESTNELKQKLGTAEDYLQQKLVFIDNLQLELQQTTSSNSTLQKNNRILDKEVERLSNNLNEHKKDCLKFKVALEKDRSAFEELQAKLTNTQKEHETTLQAHDQVQKENAILYKEVTTLKCKISNLQTERDVHESNCSKKQLYMRKFVHGLQSEFKILQAALASVGSDKQFLRRLCNDLKYALETCVNQNKVLRRRLHALSANFESYNSLPNIIANLPSPIEFDDTYIKQLLQQFKIALSEEPLVNLENGLNSLKNEMNGLKKQIIETSVDHD